MLIKIVKNIFPVSLFIKRETRLDINNFEEYCYNLYEKSELTNYFVNNKPGGIMLEYYQEERRVGYIRYYNTTGQIGLFFIEKPYQNRGLGKQILSKVIKDLQENNCNECWVVTTKKNNFWSNVYNKSFTYRDPAHSSVTGNGYFIDLKKFNIVSSTNKNELKINK
jgi:GNAT superfamily N-acetyltransferase